MMRTHVSPASTGTTRQTLIHALRSEWIKMWSLRSTWVTVTIAASLTIAFGVIASYAVHAMDLPDQAKHAFVQGVPFGEIAVAVLGAVLITSEYSSQQIRSSLAAVPNRSRLLSAKVIVLFITTWLVGAGSVFLAWLLSLPFLGDSAAPLTDTHQFGLVWGSGLAFAMIALMSFGFGLLTRSTAASIAIITVLMFVIKIPLLLASMKWEWISHVLEVMPDTVSGALADPYGVLPMWAEGTNGGHTMFLSHTQALGVSALWIIIPVGCAWVLFSRRDA